jgi:acyl-CoA synthetase (NDP forming)
MNDSTSSRLDLLFNPRSIAVAGASNKAGKLGNLFMQRLAAQFRGLLYAINPGERAVAGLPTHSRIADVPEEIDLLIALLPAERFLALVEACPPGKVRYLLAIPSGFAEMSAEGRDRQHRLVAVARERGMRVLGPNIVGIMNGVLGLNASLMPALPPGGNGLSCVTQSGGFGMALSMYALDHDIPVAKFCDLGNMADLQVHDMIPYLADDPETLVIALFLEAVREREPFLKALKTAAEKKPVIFTGVGRQAAGRRASLAHLGLEESVSGLVGALPASVIHAETGLDLLNAANALLRKPRVSGNRVAIVTGTGGIGAELADLSTSQGLAVPEFSERLQSRLRSCLPAYAGVGNPVDLTPIWWDYPSVYPRILDAVVDSAEVDFVMVCVTDVATTLPELVTALLDWNMRRPSAPIVVYWGARDSDCAGMRTLESNRIPCFRSTREVVGAARALIRTA